MPKWAPWLRRFRLMKAAGGGSKLRFGNFGDLTVAGGTGRGEIEKNTQARTVVFKLDFDAMRPRDRRDKCEAKTVPWRCSASIAAVKPAKHGLALPRRDAGTGIRHNAHRPLRRYSQRHFDLTSSGRVCDGIFDEIDQHLRDQFAIAPDADLRFDPGCQSFSALLCDGAIGFGDPAKDLRKIGLAKLHLLTAGFDLRNAEKGCERF